MRGNGARVEIRCGSPEIHTLMRPSLRRNEVTQVGERKWDAHRAVRLRPARRPARRARLPDHTRHAVLPRAVRERPFA